MLFNSVEFLCFLPIVLLAYHLGPARLRKPLLLAASYWFYAAWDPRFLALLILSTGVDFACARAMTGAAERRRRELLLVSLVVNLGVLGYFKYAGFFMESLSALLGSIGVELPPLARDVVLPVGISFYTFQTLSYTLDIYRGRLEPTRNVIDFALFVAFFPQLVAGPIERASRLLPQIMDDRRAPTWQGISSGSWLILWGLFKKVVIADNVAKLVDGVYQSGADPTGIEVLVATYAFAVQIYCDFSGYTDIARGVARFFGIELMLNFKWPFFATSPSDYWRRWHISLSTWLRDYLYISLGGNRRAPGRVYLNLMATMLLGGLWHGAAWNFVIWGIYHGSLLVAQRLLGPMLSQLAPSAGAGRVLWRVLEWFVTFQLMAFGWMIFRAPTLDDLMRLIGTLLTSIDPGMAASWIGPLVVLLAPLLLVHVAQARSGDKEVVLQWPLPARVLTYSTLICAIVVLGEDFGAPFIYFQF
jgi:alginate O-acetyltransferase complex protein AlgI